MATRKVPTRKETTMQTAFCWSLRRLRLEYSEVSLPTIRLKPPAWARLEEMAAAVEELELEELTPMPVCGWWAWCM